MAEPANSLLSQNVLRNLGDRSYEKRKQAALEIEHMIKELHAQSKAETGTKESINQVIRFLTKEYAYSTQSNHRKGGLIGLAAASIALMEDTTLYLNSLLPPVLKCFADQESRVRYYACESLYNITKVARGQVLIFFNEIFDGLCKLYADHDADVKNGAALLDRLLKDVVTEQTSFDVNRFVPLLRERIKMQNPYIRQLLVGWITVLDSVPDIDMLAFLPQYLGGLFDMLSDPNKDIRQQAFSALSELLKELTTSEQPQDLGSMVLILVAQCDSSDNFTRLTGLSWLFVFIDVGQAKLLSFAADILGAVLNSISDREREIRVKAAETNRALMRLVETAADKVDIDPLLTKVTLQLVNKHVPSRMASLSWISMLLTKMPGELFTYLNELFPALLKTLKDPDDQVVRLDLEVLARISLDKEKNLDSKNFEMVLNELVQLCSADRNFLETRGSLIIRQLSLLLNGESIYRALAKILSACEDLEFVSLMVQTLNLILMTATELFELRASIKQSLFTEDKSEGTQLFITLYNCWCHNPVSTFTLCLLAQTYELASAVAFQLADIEVTVNFLMQIDKLVQLLESPIFIHLRLQLLEPKLYPFLLKSLYGLLMLLPQSGAFKSLKERLESVTTLGLLNCIPESEFAVPSLKNLNNKPDARRLNLRETERLNFQDLLLQFKIIQARHQTRLTQVFRQNSLLTHDSSASTSHPRSSSIFSFSSSAPGAVTAAFTSSLAQAPSRIGSSLPPSITLTSSGTPTLTPISPPPPNSP